MDTVVPQDTRSSAAGVELFSIRQWAAKTREMRKWFGEPCEAAEDDVEDAGRLLVGTAIGQVPHSGQ